MNLKIFARRVLGLAGGVAASQLIGLLFLPYLTKVYGPTAYGVFASFSYWAMLAGIITTLRLDGIFAVERHKEVRRICFGISLGVSFLFFVLFLIAALSYTVLSASSSLSGLPVILFTLAGAMGIAVFQFSTGLLTSEQKYKTISIQRVEQTTVGGIAQAALSVAPLISGLGLIIGELLSRASSLLVVYPILKTNMLSPFHSWRRAFHIFKRELHKNKNQIFFGTLSSIVSTACVLSPIFFFSSFISAKTAGVFFIAYKITSIPVTLLGRAASQVVLGDVSKIEAKELPRAFQKVAKLSLVVAGLVTFTIIILSYFLPYILHSEEWIDTPSYMRSLVGVSFGQIFLTPLVQIYLITKRQRDLLIWECLRFIVVHGALALGLIFLKASPVELVWIYSFFMLFSYLELYRRLRGVVAEYASKKA